MDGGSAGFAGAVHRSIQLIYLGLSIYDKLLNIFVCI